MGGQVACEFEEEGLSSKWFRCQQDAVVKTMGGLGVGTLGSLLMLRMSVWPAMFGAGLGLGLAYINCEEEINKSLRNSLD